MTMKKMILCICTLALLAVACRKEEFQQAPYGEKVPFTDTVKHDVKTLVSMSASHRLLYAAWQKSTVDEAILAALGKTGQVTVFAPDDAAMRAAGFDEAAIAAATPAEMDSLVLLHVVINKLDTVMLGSLNSNIMAFTLLKHHTKLEQVRGVGVVSGRWEPYRFRQYVSIRNGHLWMNGKDAGNAKPQAGTNGILWPISKVAERPRLGLLEFLRSDPRFSIYTNIVHMSDSAWEVLTEGMGYMRDTYVWLVPQDPNYVQADAIFAPTNEAFRKAGFNTVEDLWQLNERSLPFFDWNSYEQIGGLVTDSLLTYHAWGRFYSGTGSWGRGATVPAVFFSDDLRNEFLHDFDVVAFANLGNIAAFTNPLEFTNQGGQVTVKVKGATQPAATIVEKDILTFEGPVHVVDQLILSNKVQF